MKGKQRAKFFCENCGAEVPADARVCKNCGRFFSSVRCPACGATGSASKFAKGCPVCGYATDSGTFNISAYSEEEKEEVRRRLTGAEQKKIKGAFAAYERK
ncbi:zinc ribbon domain-containing protein, partial [Treponema socranskii]